MTLRILHKRMLRLRTFPQLKKERLWNETSKLAKEIAKVPFMAPIYRAQMKRLRLNLKTLQVLETLPVNDK